MTVINVRAVAATEQQLARWNTRGAGRGWRVAPMGSHPARPADHPVQLSDGLVAGWISVRDFDLACSADERIAILRGRRSVLISEATGPAQWGGPVRGDPLTPELLDVLDAMPGRRDQIAAEMIVRRPV